jgi:tetratricopeptide (TPR) repeat protein
VPQVEGDGFMAVFGVPAAHDDDAERAVRAALELIEYVERLNRRRRVTRIPPVHAGVNSGEVTVLPSREISGYSVVGTTVNLGARLASVASAGQVMVGQLTHDLTDRTIRYGPRLRRRVKGRAEPLAVFRALATRSRAHLRAGPARFVGRDVLLERLATELHRAVTEGRSRILVVRGDPGLGKSSLGRRFAGSVTGTSVLEGRCPPYGRSLPLFPIAESIFTLAGIGDAATIPEQEAAADELARRLGRPADRGLLRARIRQLIGLEESTGAPRPLQTDAALAAREVIEALGRRSPVLAILDDVQWADPDLMQLLAAVGRDPWPCPLLFLCLSRPDLAPGLEELPVVDLPSLDAGDGRAILSSVLGDGLPDLVVDRLLIRAGGNPLFLEESARMLVETRGLVGEPGAWTLRDPAGLEGVATSLRALVAARLDTLGAHEKRVLQDASVAGQATWHDLVVRMAAAPETEAVLDSLIARDLLRPASATAVPGSVQYGFKHEMIRDVAYESLPLATRAKKHLQVVSWLEEVRHRFAQPPIVQLAHHASQAYSLGVSQQPRGTVAIEAAGLAAEHLVRWADQVLAHEPLRAEAIYSRAGQIAEKERGVVSPRIQARLRVGHAQRLILLGRHREALTEARKAKAIAERADLQKERALALLAIGRAESSLGETLRARRRLEDALVFFERSGDTVNQARALQRLAETFRYEDYAHTVDLWERANTLLRVEGTPAERASSARILAYILTVQGGRRFREAFREAERLTDEQGDLARAGLLRTAGYHAYYQGDMVRAIHDVRAAQPLARRSGDRWVEVDAQLMEAMIASTSTSVEEGRTMAARIVDIAKEVGARHLLAMGQLWGARPALRSGKPQAMQYRLRSAREILSGLGVTWEMAEVDLVEAGCALDRGAWEHVSAELGQTQALARATGLLLWVPQVPLLRGRARLGAGDFEGAVRELGTARRLSQDTGAVGHRSVASAALAQARLLLGESVTVPRNRFKDPENVALHAEATALRASRSGDLDAASLALDEAVQAWERLGLTIWQARARILRADLAARRRRRRQAAEDRESAEQIMRRLRTPHATVGSVRRLRLP